MKRVFIAIMFLAAFVLISGAAQAEQIRAFVSEFKVIPPESSDLKATLQTLLSTRLSGDGITPAASERDADVVIAGSFIQIGKVFSVDASAKMGQEVVATVFEQGESQDALIPAIGKVAAKLKAEILKRAARPVQASPVPQSVPAPAPALSPAPAPAGEPAAQWVSPRIAGAKSSLAPATEQGGKRDIILADGNLLQLIHTDRSVKILAEEKIPLRMKVLSVDTMKQANSGATLAFVTIVDEEAPSSRVYVQQGDKLTLAARDLPYLFRVIALNGGERKLYAQQMGRHEDFYGDVYEAVYEQGKIAVKNPLKMPRYANIFNFNRFTKDGKSYQIAFSESGYLVVFNDQGEEIWRSSEKFGGSENYFERRDADQRVTGSPIRKRFLDPRILVTEKGEIVVPQNEGFFVIGNVRSYSKYVLASFAWNGSSLEERWRTKTNQNYLADFYYEPASRELVLLEVVQKEGMFGKGGSAVRTMRLP